MTVPDCLPLHYFYPRPPRGGRQLLWISCRCFQRISIHALREEGDLWKSLLLRSRSVFLSTPSARRATLHPCGQLVLLFISIHALREEGDGGNAYFNSSCSNFYPRPPRGGRLHHNGYYTSEWLISIHALREEGDEKSILDYMGVPTFLSTPSARRATSASTAFLPPLPYFYPRPPRGGRQQKRRKHPRF